MAGLLLAGKVTSRALIEQALARIADPAGEGGRVFLRDYRASALVAADAGDALRTHGMVASPLAGLPVSIKDLFDVAGDITRAGSKVRDDALPATADAAVVARLKLHLGLDKLVISATGTPETAPMEGPFAMPLDFDGSPGNLEE